MSTSPLRGDRLLPEEQKQLSTRGRNFDDVSIGPTIRGPPGPTRDAAPAGEPVPGTEGAVLGRPTRGKGEPASGTRPEGGCRRQASEGRPGGTGDTSQ